MAGIAKKEATASEKAQLLGAIEGALAAGASAPDDKHRNGRVEAYQNAGVIGGRTSAGKSFDMLMDVDVRISQGNGDQSNGVWDINQVNISITSGVNLGDSSRSSDALYNNNVSQALLAEIAQKAGLVERQGGVDGAKPFVREPGEFSFSGAGRGSNGSTHMDLTTTLNTNKADFGAVTEAITALKEQYASVGKQTEPAGEKVTGASEVQPEIRREK